MKRLFYLTVFLLMACVMPYKLYAQSGTLVIHATPQTEENSLDAVITADQASANPHLVYELASTDTPYVFYATITIDNDVVIRGIPAEEDGRIPTIMPVVLTESIPSQPFAFTKDGANITLENLYLLGISIDNTIDQGNGMALQVIGDNTKTLINNVVFEAWSQFAISASGQNQTYKVINSTFRNMVNTGSVYTGEAFRMRNDLGVTQVDTVIMRNNTFLAVNAYALCAPIAGYLEYGEFSHNTVISMLKNVIRGEAMTNFKISNNIFYAAYSGGQANGEFPAWDNASAILSSVVDAAFPLSKVNASLLGIDTSAANWSDLAEAARTVDVSDNIYFNPTVLENFYTTWNASLQDTAFNYIHINPWMNPETAAMFADDTKYPGLSETGTVLDTDPVFGQGIADMFNGGEGYGLGVIGYLQSARGNGGSAGDSYGYMTSAPDFTSGNWVPAWPLPEMNDLKYTASLTGSDGEPYGNLAPYGTFVDAGTGEYVGVEQTETVADNYSLSQNYPNPFNPTTKINFSLATEGMVKLKVYNIVGQEVATLVNQSMPTGKYSVNFDASGLSTGIYIYRLETNKISLAKKMILIK